MKFFKHPPLTEPMFTKTVSTTCGKLKITTPATLNQVTLGQMMELQGTPEISDLEAISILSEVPVEQLKNVTDITDLEAFGQVILSLSGQIKHLYNSDDIPGTVTFPGTKTGKKVKVIHNLSVEPAGAFLAARDVIAEEISAHIRLNGEENWQEKFNPSLKACCQVLAHYFYCKATGDNYNEYKAEEFVDDVKKLRVTEALPIAKHFFTCYPVLSKPKTGCFRRLLRYLKNVPGYNRSKSLNTSTQSTPSLAEISPNGLQY